MQKVLITGAAGYLGNAVTPAAAKYFDVVALDTYAPAVDFPSGVLFVKGSVTDERLTAKLMKGVDIVLHLAAVKGSRQCSIDPIKTIETNVLGTHTLLKNAIAGKVKRFIFSSTYWVYGAGTKPPYNEETAVAPDELYGLSKVVSETEIISSGIDYSILRFANIFGMGCGRGNEEVAFTFIDKAFSGLPLVLDGGGKQRLDFIDIEDVVSRILSIMRKAGVSKQIFNVGSGRPTRVLELARMVGEAFEKINGRKVKIVEGNNESGILNDRWLSVGKLEKMAGKMDLKPLRASIEEYIKKYEAKRR